jgi:ADP-ribose pyrophosphatase YjhB (NUDIX family)
MNDERPAPEDQLKTGPQHKAGEAMETKGATNDRPAHRATKEVSVLAWVDDGYGHVLFVRQVAGKRLWSLPGGKVAPNESLEDGLRRETLEEIGVHIAGLEFVTILIDRQKLPWHFSIEWSFNPGK